MNDYSGEESNESSDTMRSDLSDVALLDAIATRDAQLRRQIAAQERDVHHTIIQTLVDVNPNLIDTFSALSKVLPPPAEVGPVTLSDPPFIPPSGTGSGEVTVKGKPFDFDWTAIRNSGIPNADRTLGEMELFVSSGSAEPPSTWNGAAIGIRFQPMARNTFVRVAPYLRYSYRWRNDSTLEVARNRGEVGVLVREQGNGPILVDKRFRLWNDGTSWYQTHSDEQDGVFTDSIHFFASSDQEFSVWFWFNSSIDFDHMTGAFDFGRSRASNSLFAQLLFVVFEQRT